MDPSCLASPLFTAASIASTASSASNSSTASTASTAFEIDPADVPLRSLASADMALQLEDHAKRNAGDQTPPSRPDSAIDVHDDYVLTRDAAASARLNLSHYIWQSS